MNFKYISLIGIILFGFTLFLLNDNSDDEEYEDEITCDYQSDLHTNSNSQSISENVAVVPNSTLEIQPREDISVKYIRPNNIEIPATSSKEHGIIVSHTGYTLSYDTINHTPFWVAWELTSSEASGSYARSNDFREDPAIPSRHAVWEKSYSGSGYDRGHMCPAADQKWSAEAMSESFFMSNMCPQEPTLNQEWWEHLEEAERRWAKKEGAVYIVCGPIYDTMPVKSIKDSFFIGLPDKFFKVILSLSPGKEKAIGFVYKNDNSRQPMGNVACPVDEVEQITGFDFFPTLDDQLEDRLESTFNLGKWN